MQALLKHKLSVYIVNQHFGSSRQGFRKFKLQKVGKRIGRQFDFLQCFFLDTGANSHIKVIGNGAAIRVVCAILKLNDLVSAGIPMDT